MSNDSDYQSAMTDAIHSAGLLTASEVADRIGIPTDAVLHAIKDGRLPHSSIEWTFNGKRKRATGVNWAPAPSQ